MIKRRRRKAFLRAGTAALAAILLVGIGSQTGNTTIVSHAATIAEYEQMIKDNEAKIAEYDKKIAEIDGDIADNEELQSYYFNKLMVQQENINLLNNQIYEKEEEIVAKEQEIADLQAKIEETEKKIEDKNTEIELLDAQNKDNIYKFGQIIRAMYITDTDDYMTIIAGSADFYDIFVKSEIMKSVSDQNLKFMNDLLDDIHRLEDDKVQLQKDVEQLEYDKQKLGEEKDQLEEERIKLDEERKYSSDLSASYTTEYNNYTSKISNLESLQADYAYKKKVSRAEIEEYEKAIDEEIRKAQAAAQGDTVYDEGEWRWPLDSRFHLITTYFGYDAWRNGNHGAIDVGDGGINGANIYASKGGEVIVAKTSYTPGYDYGMYVVIDHGNGYQTLYAHCSAIYVSVGQKVNKGDVIAAVGSTGWSTGPHLHFEVRKDGARQDPLAYVSVPG